LLRADRVRMLERIGKQMGAIHILVSNAGVSPRERVDILRASEESFERVMNINLKGSCFLTQAVAHGMIDEKRRNPEGLFCIINISSSNALAASTARGEYYISKAGVSMATKLWAVRLAEFGIPVYEIRPGIIDTAMTAVVKDTYDTMIEEGLLLQKRWGTADDVGRAAAMLACGDLPYSTGQVIHVDGGQLISRL